jgi:Transposase IS116/IS110/IS902 family
MPTCTACCRPTASCVRRSRCWPSLSGRDLAAHQRAPSAAVPAARVLSDLPGGLHEPIHAGDRQPRGTRRAGHRPHTDRGSQTVGESDRCGVEARWPQPRDRSDRGRDQSRIAETPTAPTSSGRERNGQASSGATGRPRHRARQCDELGHGSAELFQQHPDYAIITSFPGLADSTGARVLAEIGDDRARFADARALKAYAGSAPVTRASGRSLSVTHRPIKNNRLASVGWMWAFSASSTFEPARQHYRQRRAHGDRHAAANRNLFNKLLGQLYHCLQHRQTFDQAKAFPAPLPDVA